MCSRSEKPRGRKGIEWKGRLHEAWLPVASGGVLLKGSLPRKAPVRTPRLSWGLGTGAGPALLRSPSSRPPRRCLLRCPASCAVRRRCLQQCIVRPIIRPKGTILGCRVGGPSIPDVTVFVALRVLRRRRGLDSGHCQFARTRRPCRVDRTIRSSRPLDWSRETQRFPRAISCRF